MPEQLLDDAQVGAALEQMCRERVAQRVWADPIAKACAGGRALDRGPRLLARQPPASIAKEERAAAGWRDFEMYPMRNYPVLQDLVSTEYHLVAVVDGVAIYGRNR